MAAALRSLAKGTWGPPAASALRLRSCAAGMSTAARSRLHGNQAEQHKNGTREATEEERADFILNELDKAEDVLRQRDKEVEELKGEMNRVTKILAVSFVGLTALLFCK